MRLSAASNPGGTCKKRRLGAMGNRSALFATNVIRTPVRSAARKRISRITVGHASASTQICISLLPSGTMRLAARVHDLQLAPHDADFLQAAENLFRHALGQIHKAVILVNVDMPDMAALEPRLVGNGPHDVARLHAVHVTHFDTKSFEVDLVRPATLLTRGRVTFLTTRRRRMYRGFHLSPTARLNLLVSPSVAGLGLSLLVSPSVAG